MAKCVDEILKAAKGALTRKEAEAIIAEVERRFGQKMSKAQRNIFAKPGKPGSGKPGGPELSLNPDGTKSRESLMQEAAVEAFAEKVNAKQEQLRRQELQIEKQAMLNTQLAKLGGDVRALESLLVDAKGETHLQGRIRSERERYLGQLTGPMDALAKDPKWRRMDPLQRETRLAEAMMNPELGSKQGKVPGATSWSAIEELAFVFRAMDDDAFQRKNAAGADIHYTPGHVPQLWDASSVRLFGMETSAKAGLMLAKAETRRAILAKSQAKWVEFVLPRVDRGRYLDPETGAPMNDEQLREVLSGIWRTIASNGLSGDVAVGEAALATSLGARREVWFKDPQSFVEANREFGARDLFSAMTGEAVRHAREIALLEMFGPNPTMGFKTLLTEAQVRQAEGNLGAGRKGSYRAEIIYNELAGKGLGPPEDKASFDALAKYDLVSRGFKGLRNLIASAKLGMLPFSQINDLATFRMMSISDGLGTGRTMRNFLAAFNPANAKDRMAARQYGIMAQMMIGDAALRFGGDTGSGQGWTSQLANATVKWSGAQHWTDTGKMGFQISIGQRLAEMSELPFEAVDGKLRQMMERYGITASDWELIRRSETVDLFGYQTMTPLTVAKVLHPKWFEQKKGEALRYETQVKEAALKVGAMMAEEADIAILQPGAKEKAIAAGETPEGTIAGEAMRSLFFFKTFTVAMMTKALPRIIDARGPGWGKAGALTEFLLANMIAGALTIQLKEIAKGRNPRDSYEPEFWAAAFMQAGGLGIFGDLFLSNNNRFGGGLAETLAGPVVGLMGDAQRLTVGNLQQAAMGEDTKFGAEAIQFGKNYAPLMNLWYTRLALDHLLFYHAQEAANPGYLRRSRRRIERENQSWWWAPTDNQPDGPPDLTQMFGGE